MARGYWLVKSEPYKYSWDQLVEDGDLVTGLDQVRSHRATHIAQSYKCHN